jgi:hypothetical protein
MRVKAQDDSLTVRNPATRERANSKDIARTIITCNEFAAKSGSVVCHREERADKGAIRSARGRITVPSRTEFEWQVCKCYAVVKREYDDPVVGPRKQRAARRVTLDEKRRGYA